MEFALTARNITSFFSEGVASENFKTLLSAQIFSLPIHVTKNPINLVTQSSIGCSRLSLLSLLGYMVSTDRQTNTLTPALCQRSGQEQP
jgi:hypothetical protein